MYKTVKADPKTAKMQTELEKHDILRLNNRESNELTRECIEMAMIYLMGEKPYDSISISEITQRAGVSRTAFYRNYSSKENVIRAIGEQVISALAGIFSKVKTSDDIHGAFVEFFTHIKEQREIVALLIRGDVSLNLLFPNAQILENAFPASSKLDHYRMAAIDAALVGLVKEWIANDCDLPVEDMVSVIELGVSM